MRGDRLENAIKWYQSACPKKSAQALVVIELERYHLLLVAIAGKQHFRMLSNASRGKDTKRTAGDNTVGSLPRRRPRDTGGSMHIPLQAQIVDAEDQLRIAMLSSDVAALNELLAPELIYTNHLGQLLGKDDDIAAYRSGVLKVETLEPSEQHVRALGDVAVVSVRMQLSGTYGGAPANGDFRFTRVWARSQQQRWQIVAAHAGLIAQ